MNTLIHRHLLSVAVLSGALATTASAANADPSGVPVAAFRLPAQSFSELRKDVAKARAVDPRSFALVTDIVALAPDANARARARRAPIALYLAKLGPNALMPMLEMLAIEPPHGMPVDSAQSIRRDLIEAVGLLHDQRALPVLAALLDDPAEDATTTQTSSEAIARIGTEEAASKLLSALATAPEERARAIVAGMGECRRLRVTEAIAERLRTAVGEPMALAAARALGRAGNAWAWRTRSERSEEARIRETAARALVDAFTRRTGEARTAAANALLIVDDPQTPALIAEAKRTATSETVLALDSLAARVARSPLHGP